MKILLTIFLVATAMLASPAQAIDGNELYKWAREWNNQKGEYLGGAYQGYLIATADALDKTDIPWAPVKFCIPDGVSNGQVGDIVFQWLEDHPEKRHYLASELVVVALSEAFPCNR